MQKQVILITGTPSVGKTTTAQLLAEKLEGLYIDLTELALKESLTKGKDRKRNTTIINETAMRKALGKIIDETLRTTIIIDGHYAPNVTPPEQSTLIFVLRRDPSDLREIMKKRGYTESKILENLQAEILDVCLVEALNIKSEAKTCEIDATHKVPEQIVKEILRIIADPAKCCVGIVDWLGKLEKEGKLDEYLRN
jgi:adenylate kinase